MYVCVLKAKSYGCNIHSLVTAIRLTYRDGRTLSINDFIIGNYVTLFLTFSFYRGNGFVYNAMIILVVLVCV